MSRATESVKEDEKIKALENQVQELVNFSKKLIDRLAKTEKEKMFKGEEIYFLPEGKYFGITID